jgi:bacterioferritin-associated ferredoxin
MYICHCRAVTDRTVAAAVAGGARSIDDLARKCGAGSRCGGCWPALRELLAEVGSPLAEQHSAA